MMESIAAASMSMSQMEFANAYDMAILKKSMESMEAQAETCLPPYPRPASMASTYTAEERGGG